MAPHLHGAPRPCGIGGKRHLEDQAARELDHVPYMNVSIHSQPVVLAESRKRCGVWNPLGQGVRDGRFNAEQSHRTTVTGGLFLPPRSTYYIRAGSPTVLIEMAAKSS